MDAAMALINKLLTQTQALGAVTAYLRLADSGKPVDSSLRPHLERVVDLLDARSTLDDLDPQERAVVSAFALSYARQAVELMEDPTRASAWSHSDPVILQAQGAASAVVARLIAESGLGGRGIRILDVGTGVAGLAIGFARTFPDSTIVGLDPWAPALALARQNVSDAGLEDRITLHALRIEEFDDSQGFDIVWFPSFFIPEPVVDGALRKLRSMLRPDGHLVVGVMEGADEPLAGAVDAMITVRSGGAVLKPEEAVARLKSAGLADAHEARRTWQAPLRLVIARAAPAPQR